jgi:glycosyltransferase involved in cell wall biosynthesis
LSHQVGILCEFGSLNGGEHSLLALVPAIRDRGWDPLVFAPSDGELAGALAEHQVRHVEFRVADDRETALERLAGLVAESRVDLLHANSLSMCRLAGRLARLTGHPTTGHLRDIVNLSATALADINTNRYLLAVSHATRDHHVAAGLDPARTRVVYNGIDPDLFQNPQRDPGWLRRELKITRPSRLVAAIGQIGIRKALDVLAEASQRVSGEIDYVIVGRRYSRKRESEEFEASVFERFEQAAPSGRVHRLGYRDDVPELLAEIDVLVHPARQEPLGRVLLEAAAAGRAILATDVGGTGEILADGRSAILVPADDPEALAAGLQALTDDSNLRARLGQQATETIRSKFPINAAAEELVGAWRTALAESDGPT